MRPHTTARIAPVAAAALLLWSFPLSALAGPGARLEGLVVGIDGRAGAGFTVHLIDPQGEPLARASTDARGVYGFAGLPAGEYGLGVETPAGELAPVAAPPIRLGENELARRDVKLLATEGTGRPTGAPASYAVGMWWAGLSPAAKAWTIVGIVVVTGVTLASLDSGDDEQDASPF
jgi:hypothetical protein